MLDDIMTQVAILLLGALVWSRHHANIGRLLVGKETKIGPKTSKGYNVFGSYHHIKALCFTLANGICKKPTGSDRIIMLIIWVKGLEISARSYSPVYISPAAGFNLQNAIASFFVCLPNQGKAHNRRRQ